MPDKYRLITRSDFDGIMSAALLREMNMIDEIEFVHPKDMQDGKVAVSARDITANLPYVEGVHLAFDHHASELTRIGKRKNFITVPDSPSAARVVSDSALCSTRRPIGTRAPSAAPNTTARIASSAP